MSGNEKISELKKMIDSTKKICVFTGAGISCPSGIPDFRSADGLYNQKSDSYYTPEQIISHTVFMKEPELFFSFYKDKMLYPDAKPNDAHIYFAELEKQGIVYITNMYNGFRCFYTTTPVEHVSDLSGLRIRGFGNAIGNNLAKYFGFANIGISWGEVFPGIQQKTLDGCEVQVATADGSRLYEVVKNIAMTKHYMLQSAFVCSANFYNSLTPSDRELFVKTMRETALEYGEIIRSEESGYYDNMKAHGVKITDVDVGEFQKAIEPLYTNNDLGFSAGLKDRLFKELGQ